MTSVLENQRLLPGLGGGDETGAHGLPGLSVGPMPPPPPVVAQNQPLGTLRSVHYPAVLGATLAPPPPRCSTGCRDPGRHPRTVLAPPTGPAAPGMDGAEDHLSPGRRLHRRLLDAGTFLHLPSKSLLGPVPNTEMVFSPNSILTPTPAQKPPSQGQTHPRGRPPAPPHSRGARGPSDSARTRAHTSSDHLRPPAPFLAGAAILSHRPSVMAENWSFVSPGCWREERPEMRVCLRVALPASPCWRSGVLSAPAPRAPLPIPARCLVRSSHLPQPGEGSGVGRGLGWGGVWGGAGRRQEAAPHWSLCCPALSCRKFPCFPLTTGREPQLRCHGACTSPPGHSAPGPSRQAAVPTVQTLIQLLL